MIFVVSLNHETLKNTTMKTIKKTKKAKLIETKTWGYEVIDIKEKKSVNFGNNLIKAEEKYNEINNKP